MEDTTVKTYNGRTELRSDCAFIRGKYYHKERDCYLYKGIYYSPFSRYVVVDNETGAKIHKSESTLSVGVIGVKEGKYIIGHYSPNIAKNGRIFLPSTMSEEDADAIISEVFGAKREEDVMVSSSDDALRLGIDSAGRRVSRGSTTRLSLDGTPMPRYGVNPFEDEPIELSRSPWDTHISEPETREHPASSSSTEDQRMKKIMSRNRVIPCINVHDFVKEGWIQSSNSDDLCLASDVKYYDKVFRPGFKAISAHNPYNFNLAYNSEAMMDSFSAAFAGFQYEPTEKLKTLAKYLGDHTYGIEYESWDGRIPTAYAAQRGLIPLRDGSLKHDGLCGFEYASVVMSGEKGLAAIKSQCEALKTYATFNEKCSMHIHIGNIAKTRDNLVKLYKAFREIQGSVYSMFPSCLMNTQEYKQKAYCSPLPALNSDADSIIYWLSDGNEKFDKFGRNHPKDRHAQSKWNIHSRYFIFNLNNYYYTQRGTVELRISTPTFNHQKVAALLTIFCLIIDAAIKDGKYYSDVVKLIEDRTGGEEKKWLIQYVKYRQKVLSSYNSDNGNVKYYETIANDEQTGVKEQLY